MGLIGINITLHVLSFALGTATLCMAVLFHIRKNLPWTKYFLVLHASLTLILVLNFIRIFASVLLPSQDGWGLNLFLLLLYGSLSFLISFLPYFTTWVIAHPWRQPYKGVFISVSLCYFLLSLTGVIFQRYLWLQPVLVAIFFGVFIFTLAVLIRNYSDIQNKDARRVCGSYIIMSVIMVPFMILDTFIGLPPGMVSFPIYYFWFSMVIFIYLASYFLHIPEAPDDVIDPLQLKKFHITTRESEIIDQIRLGLTNREIAEKLCISPYTVNNHIANVYEKTGVRSRIDLLNLMKPRI